MASEIKAPAFPESIADGVVAAWLKQPGEACSRDEVLVEIETDKVVMEVVAPADGALTEILKQEGDTVLDQELLAHFEAGAGAPVDDAAPAPVAESSGDKGEESTDKLLSPAARQLVLENNLDAAKISGTGKGGRITKEDVVNFLSKDAPAPVKTTVPAAVASPAPTEVPTATGERTERRVPMTRLRSKVAERLLDATNNTAMLTTFNEVNMQPLMDLRNKYKEQFEKAHNGTRLGFMSFFVRASVEALKRFPIVNASIDGDDIVYHGYQDVGCAVSTDRGLVVPVLRDANYMSLADVEAKIREFGLKAREGKLTIDDMTGGTFTLSNGGVFGSLLSTPILNPPQTGILGMHKIQDRPVAENGQVVIRPMMYLALSYDHRLIDGKDAVQFLVAIKDMIEDPARILLEM